MSANDAVEPSTVRHSVDLPLAVDMDGTLIDTDSLVEGAALVVKRSPLLLFLFPWWMLRGKAAFKREIASRSELDVQFLPYNTPLLDRLREEQKRRSLVLCTAADRQVADAVAAHVGLFDVVMATDGQVNLNSRNKARALVERYGDKGFDYAGNDTTDLPVFAASRSALVVNPTPALRWRLRTVTNLKEVIHSRSGLAIAPYLRAMRPHQWVKNLLVFLPMLATLDLSRLGAIVPESLAFLAFCLVASSGYLFNDVLDLNADRRHPRKRLRPLAAGTVPIRHALVMIPALAVAGLLVGTLVTWLFLILLIGYGVTTVTYTVWLKRVPLLETLILAGLYTCRVLAGAAAIAVVPSFWLLAFSMFFFLSLALAKRHSELVEPGGSAQLGTLPGRPYRPEDLATLLSQGSASGYAAVLVLALFVDSSNVRAQYNHPEIIWLICPLLLYWINKLWLNSQRREINDDPVVWALTNRVSRAVAILSVALLLLAKWLPR